MTTINAIKGAHARYEKIRRVNEALASLHALETRLLKFRLEVEDQIVGPEIEL